MIIRQVLYTFLDRLGLHSSHPQGDIFVFTVPRSGLTWLTEIFDTIPKSRCVKEIFGPWNISRMALHFEPKVRYLNLEQEELIGIRNYIGSILRCEEFRVPYNPLNPSFKFRTNINVIVISKAANLSTWIEDTFKARVLYLVRHPIANAVSKCNNSWVQGAYEAYPNPGWEGLIDIYLTNENFCKKFLSEKIVSCAWDVRRNGSDLQRYVLNWCLDNIVPLRSLPERNWHLVTYEDMVMNFEETVKGLFEHFGLRHVEEISKLEKRPSGSTSFSSDETIDMIRRGEKRNLINRWKQHVTKEEITACFQILDVFKLDIYQEDSTMPNPKYNLYKLPGRPDLDL